MLLFYQEPPPPPPEPPPDKPPPEEPPPPLEDPPEELDGLDDIALWAESIVEFINVPKEETSKPLELSYQDGACNDIDSNFLIHLSDTPKT